MKMLFDPFMAWPGAHPYGVLNGRLTLSSYRLDPQSSAQEVNNAAFDLMMGGALSYEERLAWDELRDPERRFLVDFFMYCVPGEDGALVSCIADLEAPVAMPDFRAWGDVPADLDALALPPLIEGTAEVQSADLPQRLRREPADIGDIEISWEFSVEEHG